MATAAKVFGIVTVVQLLLLLAVLPTADFYSKPKYDEAFQYSYHALVVGSVLSLLLAWEFSTHSRTHSRPHSQPQQSRTNRRTRTEIQVERAEHRQNIPTTEIQVERAESRQISPDFYQSGQIARLAFTPLRILPPLESFKGNGKTNRSDNECAICLEEFKNGELIQPFPKCTHRFHSSCINSWVHSGRSTCPVCRCSLQDSL